MNGAKFVFIVAVLCAVERSLHVSGQGATESFSIIEGDFSCSGNLRCSGYATTTAKGLLKLTPDPPGRTENYTYFLGTVGVALFNEPVQLLNRTTNKVASLSANFSFLIESGWPNDTNERLWSGDGLAFVMFDDETWIGASGGSLGVFNTKGAAESDVKTLAVEFDTFWNEGIDNDNNHVGIDTTNITSVIAKRARFDLVGGRVYAWINYDPQDQTLEVRVGVSAEKPRSPLIRYTVNLLDVFQNEKIWVGFSGANGGCYCFSYYTVYDLSFSSSFVSLLPATAAPSPSPSTPVGSKKSTAPSGIIAAGVTGGVAAVLAVGCLLHFCARRKGKMRRRLILGDGAMAAQESQIAGLSPSLKMYSFNQLCTATNNFSDTLKLGQGGFGSVYLGSIPETDPELLVAVKKVSSQSKQGEREFVAEVSTIRMLRHRNIVQLLGWCSEGLGKYLLVYEFMPNGSLDRHLYPGTKSWQSDHDSALSWEVRFKILGGLAAALHYLHEGWRQQVIHRDVKSSNVMLDNNFNAMLGDFGLARIADHYKNPETTGVAGTFGYIDPEAAMTGKYTVKSDVFSFGAVCLEIACGRKAYGENYQAEDALLVDYVWRKLAEDDLVSVVDSRLEGKYNEQEVEVVLLLGLLCSHPRPEQRPPMHRVIDILAGSVDMPPISKTKPEAKFYGYSYQDRKKQLVFSVSGTRENEIRHQSDLTSSGPNSTTSYDTRSVTRSSLTSNLTSDSSGRILGTNRQIE